MTVTEKIAYLKGLTEGLEAGDLSTSRGNKVVAGIIDVLDDLAAEVEHIGSHVHGGGHHHHDTDADDDLADTEVLFGDDESDISFDDDDTVVIRCPFCKKESEYPVDDILDSPSITCPKCGEELLIDHADEEDEVSGCGCGHCHKVDIDDDECIEI
ncbi:hypothetical protein FACS1894105_09510 [Clostridia bacterium]|nr:hypothetical protein FACS1894105_09510 [Clostridia bacterium]